MLKYQTPQKTSGTSQVFYLHAGAAENALRWWKGMKLMLQTYSIILLCKVFFPSISFFSSYSSSLLQTLSLLDWKWTKKSSIFYIYITRRKIIRLSMTYNRKFNHGKKSMKIISDSNISTSELKLEITSGMDHEFHIPGKKNQSRSFLLCMQHKLQFSFPHCEDSYEYDEHSRVGKINL